MKILHEIISKLKPEEIRTLRYLYQKKNQKSKVNRLQLFDLLRKSKMLTDYEASKIIYRSKPNHKFNALKNRLLKDLMDILLYHDSAVKFVTPYSKAVFECMKSLTQGRILLTRGCYSSAIYTLKNLSIKAKEFDLPLLQIMADELLSKHIASKEGENGIQNLLPEIKNNLEKASFIYRAQEIFQKIEIPNAFNSNSKYCYIKLVEESMKELKIMFEKTQSPNVGFYYYYTGTVGYRYIKQYSEAHKYALLFLEFLNEQISVKSQLRIAVCNMQLSMILLHLNKHSESLKYAKKGTSLFPKNSLNELRAMEILFEVEFHSKKIKEARQILESAFNHPCFDYSGHSAKKWFFFKNNLLFAEGKYNEIHFERPNKNDELMKDKQGYFMGSKILELMTLIELQKYNETDNKLTTFKLFLWKQSKVPIESVLNDEDSYDIKRVTAIYFVLKCLNKNSYDNTKLKPTYNFELTQIKCTKYLELLTENKGEYEWDPEGYELIRFDEWFLNKCAVSV